MQFKDWVGNQKSVYTTLGTSNHTDKEREQHDYYATDPKAMELLLAEETFAPVIWECACGEGNLVKVLERHGFEVIATDLIYRGIGIPEPLDFLKDTLENFEGDIITNPPYKRALEFTEKALEIIQYGHKVAMFLKIQFLEGKKRKEFFMQNPPKRVYVLSSRLNCALNGDFENHNEKAICYAWFVWEKGFKGDPVIKWIN